MKIKILNAFFLAIITGNSYAVDFAAIKADADDVIKICGYDKNKTYNLYVATLDSIHTINGVSRDNLNKDIKSLLESSGTSKCVSIEKSAKEIKDHYKLTLNTNNQ